MEGRDVFIAPVVAGHAQVETAVFLEGEIKGGAEESGVGGVVESGVGEGTGYRFFGLGEGGGIDECGGGGGFAGGGSGDGGGRELRTGCCLDT